MRRFRTPFLLMVVAVSIVGAFLGQALSEEEASRMLVPEENVRELAEHFLRQKAELEKKDIEIERWYGIRDVYLPQKEGLEVTAEFPENFPFDKYTGFALCFRTPQETLLRLEVRPYLKCYEAFVVARNKLEKDRVLQAQDVALARFDKNDPSMRNVLQDPNEAIGKSLRVEVPQGAPIGRHMLKEVQAVSVGDEVELLVKGSGYQIRAKGIAKQAGAFGEEVEVMNSATKKTVRGRVVGEKRVRVDAP